jgi:hypothetical protein
MSLSDKFCQRVAVDNAFLLVVYLVPVGKKKLSTLLGPCIFCCIDE